MKFTKTFKIFLFKDKGKVDFTIKVNKVLAITYWLSVNDFETMLAGWKKGVNVEANNQHWHLEYKKFGPRPESQQNPYVKISVSANSQRFNYRVTYAEMEMLEKDYFYQKHNEMFWDV